MASTNGRNRHAKKIEFTIWEPYDDNSKVCRFVTSWATTDEQMSELEKLL